LGSIAEDTKKKSYAKPLRTLRLRNSFEFKNTNPLRTKKNIMQKLKFSVLFIAIITLFIGCKPKENTSEGNKMNEQAQLLMNKTWKLVGTTYYEKDQYNERPNDEKGLTITFQEDGKISYQLSVNNCFGSYTLDGENMSVTLGGCTKMCCDSKFADQFQNILSTAKSYKVHGENYLAINGETMILKLEKVED
jgi:heat shock protein HslJ